MRHIPLILLAFGLLSMNHPDASAQTITPGPESGYGVGNFSITGEPATSGQFLARVLYNPPEYGKWLEAVGSGQLVIRNTSSGTSLTDRNFASRSWNRRWPFADGTFSDGRFPGLTVSVRTYSPAAYDDITLTSIPALMAEITLFNDGGATMPMELAFEFDSNAAWEGDSYTIATANTHYALRSYRLGIAFDRPAGYVPPANPEGFLRLTRRVDIPAEGSAVVRFLFLVHLSGGYYANTWGNWDALAGYCYNNWDALRAGTEDIDRRMPSAGDSELDGYGRWYATAGVSLTKALADGNVLTMGYTELNQRDSFWTSWIHLFLWPSADRKMIRESASFQRADGKIPTTVLPVIERETDIDINEYFILRVFRQYEWTRDDAFLNELWPAVKRAVEYLINRDTNGDRVPDTVDDSYWADWKDVYSYLHRKYGAHFCLLWLAVLDKAATHADHLGDTVARDRYRGIYNQARAKIDSPRNGQSGGLWTGNFYANIWKGGIFDPDDRVLEDQTVGGVFNILDPSRARLVFNALAPNEKPWGVRETYPYYPTSFLPNPGQYHNGAVWPWLNFADCFARYNYGYPDEAERILRKVGYYDLAANGDYLPHENVDGETGVNSHHKIQAWNACYVGTLAFGALGVKRTGPGTLELFPRVDSARSLNNILSLPEGTIQWEQAPSGSDIRAVLTSSLNAAMDITYGFRIPAGHLLAGQGDLTIGDCEYRIRTTRLNPGQRIVLSMEGAGAATLMTY